jgi:LacI family transcriptional regulator
MGQWAIEHLNPESTPGKRYPIAKLECSLVNRHSVAAPRAEARQILDGAHTSP